MRYVLIHATFRDRECRSNAVALLDRAFFRTDVGFVHRGGREAAIVANEAVARRVCGAIEDSGGEFTRAEVSFGDKEDGPLDGR